MDDFGWPKMKAHSFVLTLNFGGLCDPLGNFGYSVRLLKRLGIFGHRVSIISGVYCTPLDHEVWKPDQTAAVCQSSPPLPPTSRVSCITVVRHMLQSHSLLLTGRKHLLQQEIQYLLLSSVAPHTTSTLELVLPKSYA